MGMLLSEKGIGPTADRVKALLEVEERKSASDVRTFLGLATYSSWFIPHFATISEPLRPLTRKEILFAFGPEQKKPFESSLHLGIFRQECTHQDNHGHQFSGAGRCSLTEAGQCMDTGMRVVI